MKIYTHETDGKLQLGNKTGGLAQNFEDVQNTQTVEFIGPQPELRSKISFTERYNLIAERVAQWANLDPLAMAQIVSMMIIEHHNASKFGKLINAKYAGRCAGTDRKFDAGRAIYLYKGKTYLG